LGVIAIFLPGWLLIMGIIPWWQQIQQQVWVQRALRGIQAAVVGLLAATLWDPIMTHSLTDISGIAIWSIGTTLLIQFRWPAWVITGLCAGIGLFFLHV
jgi:chromate transporter